MKPWFFDPHYQQPVADTGTTPTSLVQIRAATTADLTGVVHIISESFHSQTGFWGWAFPLFRLGIYEDIRYRLTSPAPYHTCLVAVNTDASGAKDVVGTIEVSLRFSDSWTYANKRYLYLSNLAVDLNYRRHGVASSLLIGCEKVCLEWGFEDIYLHVLEDNHQARKLYYKLGYRVQEVEPPWSGFFLNRSRQLFLHKGISGDPVLI
ncbi:GNAT family N-acetyltransferase [Cronbergia sp. UHCC 0137]|uniref:GNAT family N-acetyltransferase n=1 Tax=Cronbergia sp. UHCC 0137 TaxID=3110239 RepID=UPI002B20553E|nr:GNAT family N-acetyltransferase [Cronbergia sp. UHCC 0137]MEA5619625.1 GNAT family N-acetyltransferase [Cronbergia sp. UHCC 0137]